MTFSLDEVRESFTSDVTKFLDAVEHGAAALLASSTFAASDDDLEPAVAELVRGFHGIAGSSSLIGLDSLSQPARAFEELALAAGEALRTLHGQLLRVHRIVAACARARGVLDEIFRHELAGETAAAQDKTRVLTRELATIAGLSGPARPPGGEPVIVQLTLPPQDEWDTYVDESIGILDDLDLTLLGIEHAAQPEDEVATLFRSYHTLKGATNAVGLTPVGEDIHLVEAFLERIVAAKITDYGSIIRTLSEQNERFRVAIAQASKDGAITVDHEGLWLRLDRVLSRLGIVGGLHRSPPEPAIAEPPQAETESETDPTHADRRFVKVSTERLDSLLDLAGELVVCRSRMRARVGRIRRLHEDEVGRNRAVAEIVNDLAMSTRFATIDGKRRPATKPADSGFSDSELDTYVEIHVLSRRLDEAATDITEARRDIGGELVLLGEDADQLSRIAASLQTEIMGARMLLVETLFSRLHLPIRDAARRSGRQVEIVTRGEQLSIDKAMSDALFAPLLHLVRNAVVHGIEPPHERTRRDKPAHGTITLAARREHTQIVIEVSDDGAGIDRARLREVGIARGVLSEAVAETDRRVLDLVFAKGVTTIDDVSDVAGRGVGGEIVKRTIANLDGEIEIATRPGAGTAFTLRLPLAMSITQAVLVRVGGLLLAIPIGYAESILRRDAADLDGDHVRIGDERVPIHLFRRNFDDGMFRTPPTDQMMIVCAVAGERLALVVDEIVSREDIVVRSLGPLLEGHPLFSGTTSRGDGEIALIIDVPGLLAVGDAVLPARRPAQTSLARQRILFVDDSLSVRKVAERILRELDVEVVSASDGIDALEKLQATAFTLVFTDLEMPRMHGYELIQEIQGNPVLQPIPIVVISSRSGEKHVSRALALGARDYITKPFSPETIGALVRRFRGVRTS